MKKSIILVGIFALGLILVVGCRQKPKETELEETEMVLTEEMVPLEEMIPPEEMVEAQPVAPAEVPQVTTTPAGKININTATQAQLQSLPRVGTVMAAAIIAGRPYKSIEEITRVPRIGSKTLENLRDLITVGQGAAAAAATAAVPTIAAPAAGKININTATLAQLQSLPRVGPATAAALIAGRPYKSIEEITRVPRIGSTTLENLRDLITVGQGVAAVAPTVAAPTVAAPAAGKININTATLAQLQSLPRVGPVMAVAIIAGRPYKSIEEITRVSRIGAKTLENLRDLITVE